MRKYIFETEHLAARKFEPDDAKHLYEIHNDDAKRWIQGEYYKDIDEAQESIEFLAKCVEKKKMPYVLAVVLKETGELIGDTGVNEVEGKTEEVEIGFIIGWDYRGNGASVRVLEKNGYNFIGEEYGAEDDSYGNGMLIYKTG